MAAKAFDTVETPQPEPALSRAWPAPTKARLVPAVDGASTGVVGAAHGRESGECTETPRPGPTVSRAWPAPTKARPFLRQVAHQRGDIQGVPPLLIYPAGTCSGSNTRDGSLWQPTSVTKSSRDDHVTKS
jgi:hypothetical protein